MDLMTVLQYGLQGVVAYGAVGVITYIVKKRFCKELDSDFKLFLLISIAFGVGFIPKDLGDIILNHLKIAITVGLAIHTANTALNKFKKENVN